ncbi:putative ABC transport system permease protein [Granulicatella balaenopterae]|uniref:Putative ABC transport system permease protein n=1 Tax=Granulicatella balaenopterae TaxID=137733 RepID=A0A1H9GYP7_9LACT|nr:ABC transporter permease [Granulicatella balaenopterae]SEQ55252.1 putative ABC transport system permease protein [Granulicatella balaenopterae]
MELVFSSITQGLLWGIMAIGVFITFRILDIADLTVEGSFPLGGAVCAVLICNGVNPLLATFLAFIAGMAAGAVSGLLHTKMQIPPLLTGIITLTALYSINLKILGKANLTLLKQTTLVSQFESFGLTKSLAVFCIGGLFVVVVIGLLSLLMKTELGLALRATGDNLSMSEANGIPVQKMKLLGYMISNGLVALSGALLTQNNGFADISMGVGTIVIGLASIILAEVMIKNLSFAKRLVTIIFGAIIYRLILVIILEIPGMDAQLVKLASAILLALILYIPTLEAKNQKAIMKINK